MIQTPNDRRPPITPQLAWRVAILGGVALALFAIVFFRLWYLQVLSGDTYVAQARDNRVRDIRVQAPRGDIVDRNGTVLVENRTAVVVQLEARKIPDVEKRLAAEYGARLHRAKDPEKVSVPVLPTTETELWARYRRLGRVLRMSARRIHNQVVQQLYLLPYSNVTLRTDVPRSVHFYLEERKQDFPGVTVETKYLRSYPFHDLAAQLFGTVGEVSPDELKESRFRGVTQGTIVGKAGIERAYDRYLRGKDGAQRVQVDSLGQPKGELSRRDPEGGEQLKLSLDLGLQRTGQQALRVGETLAKRNGNPGVAGAFVAIDPRSGEILGMGSDPSFDPNIFSKPVEPAVYNALNSEQARKPLFNRAIAGAYPTGSTFKPITAMAALQSGLITPDTPINDPGKIKIANIEFHNAGDVANGTIALRRALQVSSDVFFYTLGRDANSVGGGIIQRWARSFGLGRPTGIDIGGEFDGLVPTKQRRDRLWEKYNACRAKGGGHYDCALKNGFVDRPWSVGDNVNLAVGQGDLQATPLQMAVAYSAIANGGRVVKPHVGFQVEDGSGRVLQRIEPAVARKVSFNPLNRQAILDGLRAAAMDPGGTSADVFNDFPRTIYGKTGTAERPGKADQSWYVCYVPDARRPIVVAVTIEEGGFGAEAAAPAARLILSEWFHLPKKVIAGKSKTR